MSPAANDDRLPEIAPDDPRLSEWIDGRLSGPEAAAVDRAVAESPELTRLVADLRGLKQSLGRLPATTPDAGFVRDTMAAIAAADERAEDVRDDLRVDAEWHKVEEERIALERAEAGADALDAPRTPKRWRWLPMIGALAAGLLVAAALNLGRVPGGRGDRTVALAPGREKAASRPASAVPPPGAAASEEGAASADAAAPADDVALAKDAGPAEDAARNLAAVDAVEQSRVPDAAVEQETRLRAGRPDADAAAKQLAAAPVPAAPAAGRAEPRQPVAAAAGPGGFAATTAPAAPAGSAVAVPAAEAAAGRVAPRPVLVVRVAGAAARERLQALIRERGATCLPVAPPGAEAVLTDPGTVLGETGRIASQGPAGKQAEIGPAGEFDFLEVAGPAPMIEALVAAFSGAEGTDPAARAGQSAATRSLAADSTPRAPADAGTDRARRELAGGSDGTARLLIRIVDVEAPTVKAEQGAAGESP